MPMSNPANPRPVRPRRSVLYVPAGNARAREKVPTLGADVVIFDLEDATDPKAKPAAREALREFFAARGEWPVEMVIRINPLASPWGVEDLLAARACRPDAILLPKVSSAEDVRAVEFALSESDPPASLRLWAMIETPRGVLDASSIAAEARRPASRLDCFVAGTNDLVKETGASVAGGRRFLVPWLMQIVLAARAEGLDVIDGVYNDFRDADGFNAECAAGVAMGFDGKTLIHPSQVASTNAAFGISPEALAEAQAIVEAFGRPENDEHGVIAIDGRMVERLHLSTAEKLIAKAEILTQRQDRS